LIDYCDPARADHADAVRLVGLASERNDVRLLALVSSLKDVYFILSRLYKDEGKAREAVRILMDDCFEIVDLLAVSGRIAVDSDEPDFEDGLVRATGEALHVDAIVSRDQGAFHCAKVRKLGLREILDEVMATP